MTEEKDNLLSLLKKLIDKLSNEKLLQVIKPISKKDQLELPLDKFIRLNLSHQLEPLKPEQFKEILSVYSETKQKEIELLKVKSEFEKELTKLKIEAEKELIKIKSFEERKTLDTRAYIEREDRKLRNAEDRNNLRLKQELYIKRIILDKPMLWGMSRRRFSLLNHDFIKGNLHESSKK